jgi:hypothetical protein
VVHQNHARATKLICAQWVNCKGMVQCTQASYALQAELRRCTLNAQQDIVFDFGLAEFERQQQRLNVATML